MAVGPRPERPTMAAARRWLDQRVGTMVTLRQTRPDGMTWEPGPRYLDKRNASTWMLDTSSLRLTSYHYVLEVRDDLLLLEYVDDDGVQVFVAAYRPAVEPEPEYDDE